MAEGCSEVFPRWIWVTILYLQGVEAVVTYQHIQYRPPLNRRWLHFSLFFMLQVEKEKQMPFFLAKDLLTPSPRGESHSATRANHSTYAAQGNRCLQTEQEQQQPRPSCATATAVAMHEPDGTQSSSPFPPVGKGFWGQGHSVPGCWSSPVWSDFVFLPTVPQLILWADHLLYFLSRN